jgi:Abortive infection alpha
MSDASEIISSGAFEKLADIVHKFAGPMAEEIGQMIGERLKLYRLKNWLSVAEKAEKILCDANLKPNAVPPRLFLPILESVSIEDDETLQHLWAGLLASASDQTDDISPSYVETLKQITPAEAQSLQTLFTRVQGASASSKGWDGDQEIVVFDSSLIYIDGAKELLAIETFERLGIVHREYDLVPPPKYPYYTYGDETEKLYSIPQEDALPSISHMFQFTRYGRRFMRACLGPISS